MTYKYKISTPDIVLAIICHLFSLPLLVFAIVVAYLFTSGNLWFYLLLSILLFCYGLGVSETYPDTSDTERKLHHNIRYSLSIIILGFILLLNYDPFPFSIIFWIYLILIIISCLSHIHFSIGYQRLCEYKYNNPRYILNNNLYNKKILLDKNIYLIEGIGTYDLIEDISKRCDLIISKSILKELDKKQNQDNRDLSFRARCALRRIERIQASNNIRIVDDRELSGNYADEKIKSLLKKGENWDVIFVTDDKTLKIDLRANLPSDRVLSFVDICSRDNYQPPHI